VPDAEPTGEPRTAQGEQIVSAGCAGVYPLRVIGRCLRIAYETFRAPASTGVLAKLLSVEVHTVGDVILR
jgi:hypothetical protein